MFLTTGGSAGLLQLPYHGLFTVNTIIFAYCTWSFQRSNVHV